jgi:hypothetical protein
VKRELWLFLIVLAATGLAWVAIPMLLIQPFGPQTPAGLAIGYAMRAASPALTLLLLALGTGTAMGLWALCPRWWARALAALGVVVLVSAAFLGQSNHFEWMFNPMPRPGFVEVSRAVEVADDDLVLAVALGPEARAYPVRTLAYHHVVNDVVAAEPIVATY